MKPPPVIRPAPPVDPRLALWIRGGIYALIGLWLAVFDDPIVPLWQDPGLLPLTIGAAIGVAVLRERHKAAGIAAYALVFVWLVFQIVDFASLHLRTSTAPFFLFAGGVSLLRATLKTVRAD